MSFEQSIDFFLFDHSKIMLSLEKSKKQIMYAITIMYDVLKNGDGRIIYVGAGTSGRIGVQDGVELYPTFGWPKNRVSFLIAGGLKSLTESVENAEDEEKQALLDIKEIEVSKYDTIIALAASGNTAYTCKVASECQKKNTMIIGIVNNPFADLFKYCNHKIILNTGPEVLAGSTRLKAGTSQKVCFFNYPHFLPISIPACITPFLRVALPNPTVE